MKSTRMMAKRFWRGRRSVAPLLAAFVSVLIALFLYGCESRLSAGQSELPRALYDENWRIAGTIPSERVEGKFWIAVLAFPHNRITRIISDELSAPYSDYDGLIGTAWFAYNEKARVIVCMGHGYYPPPDPEQPLGLGLYANDVWIHDRSI